MLLVDTEIDKLEIIDVSYTNRIMDSSSSKGNKPKWYKDNIWIKLDNLGYESIAEVMTSYLLNFTDLNKDEYVEYKSCLIRENGKILGRGCYSTDFSKGYTEISIADMLNFNNMSYSLSYDELREYIYDIVGYDIKEYIDKILCIDSIIRNEDRHYRNILFLAKDNIYKPAPIFDNGAGCMSDIVSYPYDVDFDTNYKSIYAKPFFSDFKENLKYNKLLKIDKQGFVSSVKANKQDSKRAFKTILKGLDDMEGIAWK